MRRLYRGLGTVRRIRRFYSTPPLTLRPYQEDCIKVCMDALNSGMTRIGVSLPTGSGKTVVAIKLLSLIKPPVDHPDAARSLVIVNSIELAKQAKAQAERLFPHWKIEIEQGAQHRASGRADVTIATRQTLMRPQRLAKFDPQYVKAIIVDEAHHAAAPSYHRILSKYSHAVEHPSKVMPSSSSPTHAIPIIGVSATFERADKLPLDPVFERIVYHADLLEMILDGWLSYLYFTSIQAEIHLDQVTVDKESEDFNTPGLARVINTPSNNRMIVQSWRERAGTRRSTLVFCVNRKHVRSLTEAFREAGIDARYVYGGMPASERQMLLSAFKAGEYPVLVNCAVFMEGTDIPNIDCVLIARPTRSLSTFKQMIGRGLRLSPETGKRDCRIIDIVDTAEIHTRRALSIPMLFGLCTLDTIDDKTRMSRRIRLNPPVELPKIAPLRLDAAIPEERLSLMYVDLDLHTLIDGTYGAPRLRTLSKYAWIGFENDVYILELIERGHIRIEPIQGRDQANLQLRYKAAYIPRPISKGEHNILAKPSKQILSTGTLAEAVSASDSYVAKAVPSLKKLLRSASWRKKPATELQKTLIRERLDEWARLACSASGDTSSEWNTQAKTEEDVARLTSGDAFNIISRLIHRKATFSKK